MKSTEGVRNAGQSIWLVETSRSVLVNRALLRYMEEFGVAGLVLGASRLSEAITQSSSYDCELRDGFRACPEDMHMDIAVEELQVAADLLLPVHRKTAGVDGWACLDLPPLLTRDTTTSIATAMSFHRRVGRPNVLVNVPGTPDGLQVIEALIFAGVPVNATRLFCEEHYCGAAMAWIRGLERRVVSGLSPDVASVASVCVGSWDVATIDRVPRFLSNRLGMAMAGAVYDNYLRNLHSLRWRRLFNEGARPQRLLFANTAVTEEGLSNSYYVEGLIAPLTITMMTESTLRGFADYGFVRHNLCVARSLATMVEFRAAGIDLVGLAQQLQSDEEARAASYRQGLMSALTDKAAFLKRAGCPIRA